MKLPQISKELFKIQIKKVIHQNKETKCQLMNLKMIQLMEKLRL